MKAAGRGTETEEVFTLTFVRQRDEFRGVVGDTGMKLQTDEDCMYVHTVRPGSVGALIGLLPGDALIQVNGKDCVDEEQVGSAITSSMSCSITVKRGMLDVPPGQKATSTVSLSPPRHERADFAADRGLNAVIS